MAIIFLIVLVFVRWFLPRPANMNKTTSYVQIVTFASAAADVIDLTEYFRKESVINSKIVFNLVWGLF